jgi:hypothetical protein
MSPPPPGRKDSDYLVGLDWVAFPGAMFPLGVDVHPDGLVGVVWVLHLNQVRTRTKALPQNINKI